MDFYNLDIKKIIIKILDPVNQPVISLLRVTSLIHKIIHVSFNCLIIRLYMYLSIALYIRLYMYLSIV
jgi:hypothetical protein